MFNIMFFVVKKKTVSHWLNTMAHFVLGFGFAIIGIYVTVVAWTAYKTLGGDIYSIKDREAYSTIDVRGQTVLVNATNVADCPAFPNCKVQEYWVAGVRKRSLISVIGCCLFDLVL